MKKLATGMIMAGMVLALAACSTNKEVAKDKSTDWEKIEQKGEIVVGVDDTFVPMGFRDENDELVGFDIDLAKAVAEELGVKAKIQPIDWSMKETELQNGTIDLIWNGYTVTEERKAKVAFTKPYLKNEQVIVTLKKNNINDYEDMKGKVIGAQEGSSGEANLIDEPELMLDLVKDNEAVLYPTFMETFLDLNNGRLDGFIIDSVFAEYYISKEDDPEKYVILPSKFGEEDYAVGARKEDKKTVDKINQAIKSLADQGKTQEISMKWFNEDKVLAQ
ncbi:amino acid ABC transporter substrate-binding protein [uncultured Vagococcus sp.]|uniref:amino acid ABC transporter substrate-binding protein n=1 Tax=uncultured Vagococcus sp. TaxID=189676 RepID=UPI0028D8052E|nr:amino acid ABC transporter substrate-binding protein [uncultured Vagococcus sp.]